MSPGTAIITGGGGAIAEAIATRLDARGYQLVLADIDRPRMEAVATRLSRSVELVEADLSTSEGIGRLAADLERRPSTPTLLVNNVGYIEPGDVTELDAATVERHIVVNLLAPMQLTRTAGRLMAAAGGGDILSIVSMGGIIALRGSASYSAAKFGLRGFHTAIRAELGRHGVRVMGVFPSGVDTPMLRKEALHPGGSPLNFVGKVFEPSDVGEACMRALDSGKLETYLPYSDSVTTRLVGAFPWCIERIEPFFARIGERGRQKFIRSAGLGGH